jgi:hypothetical protein
MVDVAAQLTGLKQMVLEGPWLEDHNAVLQLTALTALEKLELKTGTDVPDLCWWSKVRMVSPQHVVRGQQQMQRGAGCNTCPTATATVLISLSHVTEDPCGLYVNAPALNANCDKWTGISPFGRAVVNSGCSCHSIVVPDACTGQELAVGTVYIPCDK